MHQFAIANKTTRRYSWINNESADALVASTRDVLFSEKRARVTKITDNLRHTSVIGIVFEEGGGRGISMRISRAHNAATFLPGMERSPSVRLAFHNCSGKAIKAHDPLIGE